MIITEANCIIMSIYVLVWAMEFVMYGICICVSLSKKINKLFISFKYLRSIASRPIMSTGRLHAKGSLPVQFMTQKK